MKLTLQAIMIRQVALALILAALALAGCNNSRVEQPTATAGAPTQQQTMETSETSSTVDEKTVDFLEVDQPPVMSGGPTALYEKVVYPFEAAAAGVEGVTQIVFTVGSDGIPRDFEVNGEKPQGLGFAEAAIEALKQTRFQPGYLDGEAVAVRMSQTVRFEVQPQKQGK